ncbi:hypothetical protein B484DRAFT_395916 [Ochromonadaceae sp. CCMP2298]|nr:hypothetical protein B484DRAFT_395916 [Ochromonadaceae sp. CCMP2298]
MSGKAMSGEVLHLVWARLGPADGLAGFGMDISNYYLECFLEGYFIMTRVHVSSDLPHDMPREQAKLAQSLGSGLEESYVDFCHELGNARRCGLCGGSRLVEEIRACVDFARCGGLLHTCCVADAAVVVRQDMPYKCIGCIGGDRRLHEDFARDSAAFKIGAPIMPEEGWCEAEVTYAYCVEETKEIRFGVKALRRGDEALMEVSEKMKSRIADARKGVVDLTKARKSGRPAQGGEGKPRGRPRSQRPEAESAESDEGGGQTRTEQDRPWFVGETDRGTLIRCNQLYQLSKVGESEEEVGAHTFLPREPGVGMMLCVPAGYIAMYYEVIAPRPPIRATEKAQAEVVSQPQLQAQIKKKLAQRHMLKGQVEVLETEIADLKKTRVEENRLYKTTNLAQSLREVVSCLAARQADVREAGWGQSFEDTEEYAERTRQLEDQRWDLLAAVEKFEQDLKAEDEQREKDVVEAGHQGGPPRSAAGSMAASAASASSVTFHRPRKGGVVQDEEDVDEEDEDEGEGEGEDEEGEDEGEEGEEGEGGEDEGEEGEEGED